MEYSISRTKALDNIFSERVRRGKISECRDSKKSAKVRPQDPSCVAWHRTRMRSPTLSTSTDVKKIPTDALGTQELSWNSVFDKS